MSHDITEYLLSKERDIYFPAHETLLDASPFVPLPTREEPTQPPTAEDPSPLFDTTTTCPVFSALGYCTFGWRCRFLGAHVARVDAVKEGLAAVPKMPQVAGWQVVEDPVKKVRVEAEGKEGSMNSLSAEEIKALQRKRVSLAQRQTKGMC